MVDREELAWAAGFADGEAYIGCTGRKDRPNKRLVISIAQVQPDPLVRFVDLFGGNIFGPYRSSHANGRPAYQYQLHGLESVQAAVAAMWPFLSEPKKLQAKNALVRYREWEASRDNKEPAGFCKKGHPFNDVNTYTKPNGRRRCRTCYQAYQSENRDRARECERAYRQRKRERANGRLDDRLETANLLD